MLRVNTTLFQIFSISNPSQCSSLNFSKVDIRAGQSRSACGSLPAAVLGFSQCLLPTTVIGAAVLVFDNFSGEFQIWLALLCLSFLEDVYGRRSHHHMRLSPISPGHLLPFLSDLLLSDEIQQTHCHHCAHLLLASLTMLSATTAGVVTV